MNKHVDPGKDLPEDWRNAPFLGKAPTSEGPTPICVRGGAVFDMSRIAPTISLLIGLVCACHQGFSANVYAIPGGLSGAPGGMLMARYAGSILQSMGSDQLISLVAAVAYLLALLVIRLLVPRYTPLAPETLA